MYAIQLHLDDKMIAILSVLSALQNIHVTALTKTGLIAYEINQQILFFITTQSFMNILI